MDYDPRDHTPTARQLLAAWTVCIGMVGVTVSLAPSRHDLADFAADTITVADPAATSGVRVPRFATWRYDLARCASAQRFQGPMSLPIERCS